MKLRSLLLLIVMISIPTWANEEGKHAESGHEGAKPEAVHHEEPRREVSRHEAVNRHEEAKHEDTPRCIVDPLAIEDLKKVKEELAERKKELDKRETDLAAKEKLIDEQLQQLVVSRDEISKLKEAKAKQDEEKVQKVVDTVLSMSPKAAAKVLAGLDNDLSVTVISRMDTDRLAKVMNLLTPERASALSEALAGVVRAKEVSQSNDRAVTTPKLLKGGEKNAKSENRQYSEIKREPSQSEPSADSKKEQGTDGT